MTVLILDGFDYQGQYTDISGGWSGGTVIPTTGRIDGNGIKVIFENGISKYDSSTIVGFAFKNMTESRLWGPGGIIFDAYQSFYSCSSISNRCKNPDTPYVLDDRIGLSVDSANRIWAWTSIWNSIPCSDSNPHHCNGFQNITTFYGQHTTPIMPFEVWNYIEFDMGLVNVNLNGEPIIDNSTPAFIVSSSGYALSGEDTGGLQVIAFNEPALDGAIGIDDFYGTDGGSFLGDMHITSRHPDADGTYTGWNLGPGGSGSTHYSRVDDVTFDGDASFNWSDTTGAKDSYLMAPLGLSSATIIATQLDMAVRNNIPVTKIIHSFIRQGGTDYESSDQFLSDESYLFLSFLSNTDPTGSPWTISNVDNDEYGIKLVS